MLGRLVSFWDGFLAGAMLVSGRVSVRTFQDKATKRVAPGSFGEEKIFLKHTSARTRTQISSVQTYEKLAD